ncbi:MAG: S8 family serine peptidase [Pseudomonadota bacterium]
MLRLLVVLAVGAGILPAHAQLRLPALGAPLGERLGPLDIARLNGAGDRLLAATGRVKLDSLRLDRVAELLDRHSDALEADPRGEPAVRHEILAWSPSAAGLAAARAAGLAIARDEPQDGLDDLRLVVLRVPAGGDTAAVLERLRALDPAGVYDFNHVYIGSGAGGGASTGAGSGAFSDAGSGASIGAVGGARIGAGNGAAASAAPRAGPAPADKAQRVGLVDSGVDPAHIVFGDTRVVRWGCADKPHPSEHGTAVAALMVGESSRFRGVAPATGLYAADIYCDSASGGSADKIAGALAWMAREKVGVINMSLVGPPNTTLERVVGAMLKRGHLLVAAVGNDGPAAPPLYPASYPGVVGVSAVDKRGRTLPEAARGPQVMFAAPGSNMVSAALGAQPYRQVRGTSYAAPIVAAMLAQQLAGPDAVAAKAALAALAGQAARAPGAAASLETGLGVVGAAYRIDPSEFR